MHLLVATNKTAISIALNRQSITTTTYIELADFAIVAGG